MGPVEKRLTDSQEFVKKGWTQFAAARDVTGGFVEPKTSLACSWCAIGALLESGPEDIMAEDTIFHDAMFLLTEAMPTLPVSLSNAPSSKVSKYNDHFITEQGEAVEWFGRAIKIAHERGL